MPNRGQVIRQWIVKQKDLVMKSIQGIHHITVFARNAQSTLDFYHSILGQRLVKTTVNFDDPGTYHLYYGDKVGTPGTIITFFPWAHVAKGIPGNGEVATTAYTIRPNSLDYWLSRLEDHNVEFGDLETRFGGHTIPLEDCEGTRIELITGLEPATIDHWEEGPVPREHALRGFHSATLWVDEVGPTANILTDQLGYELAGKEDARWRYRGASNDIGLYIDLLERPGQARGRPGAGSVHHIAFRTVDDTEQREYHAQLKEAGIGVTSIIDRQYFHSIYFREPNGVLFEVATDAPGFAYDEQVDDLGYNLMLPHWLEEHRATIASSLPKLTHPTSTRRNDL